jgi:hypothetical protein
MKRFANLAQQFPHARYHPELRLITWFPDGVLDDERADAIVEFLETEERAGGLPFHRFTDMSGYERIQLSIDHVFTIAKRRKHAYRGGSVRSAFYAVRLISLSIARIYQELMVDTPIEVQIFRERKAAAAWLEVPLAVIERPKAA